LKAKWLFAWVMSLISTNQTTHHPQIGDFYWMTVSVNFLIEINGYSTYSCSSLPVCPLHAPPSGWVFMPEPRFQSTSALRTLSNATKKQENLPQIDRASAFVVNCVKYITSSLTVQNLFSHTVCAHIGGPKNFFFGGGTLWPNPLGWERGWNTLLPYMCYHNTCVIVPKFVALGQNVWA